jgi:hypothetical protein
MIYFIKNVLKNLNLMNGDKVMKIIQFKKILIDVMLLLTLMGMVNANAADDSPISNLTCDPKKAGCSDGNATCFKIACEAQSCAGDYLSTERCADMKDAHANNGCENASDGCGSTLPRLGVEILRPLTDLAPLNAKIDTQPQPGAAGMPPIFTAPLVVRKKTVGVTDGMVQNQPMSIQKMQSPNTTFKRSIKNIKPKNVKEIPDRIKNKIRPITNKPIFSAIQDNSGTPISSKKNSGKEPIVRTPSSNIKMMVPTSGESAEDLDGATCEKVTIGFWECTKDGKKYYCTGKATNCELAKAGKHGLHHKKKMIHEKRFIK